MNQDDLAPGSQPLILAPLVPIGGTRPWVGGRPASYPRRDIVDVIRYLVRTGCQWDALPVDFPTRAAGQALLHVWTRDGTLNRLHNPLREQRAPTMKYTSRVESVGTVVSGAAPIVGGVFECGFVEGVASLPDGHAEHLTARFAAGVADAVVLHAGLAAMGFDGSVQTVLRYCTRCGTTRLSRASDHRLGQQRRSHVISVGGS